jgi:hypothetical protein
MICHKKFVPFTTRTKFRKGCISYFKSNRITTSKKHVDAKHTMLAKKFEEEIAIPIRSGLEKQPTKKRPSMFANEVSKFFLLKILLRRMMCNKNHFCKTLVCWLLKVMFLYVMWNPTRAWRGDEQGNES